MAAAYPSSGPALTSQPFDGFAAAADGAVVQLNRQLPGMGLWLVTYVLGDRQRVVASAGEWAERTPIGTEFSWQASFCLRMVNGAPPLALDVLSVLDYRAAAIGPLAPVRAYLGVPLLTAEDELFGTLCAVAGAPQPDSWHEAMPVVSLMGRMLSTVLARERAARDRSMEAAHAYALADRDPRTHLRNRRGFDQAVQTEQGRGRRFGTRSSIIVLSLEDVAAGASAADVALRGCAQVLVALCEPGDVAARTEGMEFGILAAETDLVGARALQTRLREALRTVGLTVSAGSATRRLGEDLTDTWERAVGAMHIDARRRRLRGPRPRVRTVP